MQCRQNRYSGGSFDYSCWSKQTSYPLLWYRQHPSRDVEEGSNVRNVGEGLRATRHNNSPEPADHPQPSLPGRYGCSVGCGGHHLQLDIVTLITLASIKLHDRAASSVCLLNPARFPHIAFNYKRR